MIVLNLFAASPDDEDGGNVAYPLHVKCDQSHALSSGQLSVGHFQVGLYVFGCGVPIPQKRIQAGV